MTVEGTILENKKFCECGCNEEVSGSYRDSRKPGLVQRRFKKGHTNKGKKCPWLVLKDEKNHRWKGDNVSYGGLHDYIKSRLPRSDLCEICKTNQTKCLACVTGIYNRDINNYRWLCYLCHNRLDIERTGRKIPEDRRCCKCGLRTYIHNGRAAWYTVDKQKNLYQCTACHRKNI